MIDKVYSWIKERTVNALDDLFEKLIFTFTGITIYSVLLLTPAATLIDLALGLSKPNTVPDIGVFEATNVPELGARDLSSLDYFEFLGPRLAFAQTHQQPVETAEVNAAKQRFKADINLVVNNDYKYIGRTGLLRKPTWCWKIYIKDQTSLPYIKSVSYDYRGWFTNETITRTDSNNQFTSQLKNGWGVFPVRVTITYQDGNTEIATYNLSFSNKGGAQGRENPALCQ